MSRTLLAMMFSGILFAGCNGQKDMREVEEAPPENGLKIEAPGTQVEVDKDGAKVDAPDAEVEVK